MASKETNEVCEKATLQFRYKTYTLVLSEIDRDAPRTQSGVSVHKQLVARNWKAVIDVSTKAGEATLNEIKASPQYGVDFWVVGDAKGTDDATKSKGATLARLLDMSIQQLAGMLSADEWREAGVVIGSERDKNVLIMAIIERKRLD